MAAGSRGQFCCALLVACLFVFIRLEQSFLGHDDHCASIQAVP